MTRELTGWSVIHSIVVLHPIAEKYGLDGLVVGVVLAPGLGR
jgi:hypothetical protein